MDNELNQMLDDQDHAHDDDGWIADGLTRQLAGVSKWDELESDARKAWLEVADAHVAKLRAERTYMAKLAAARGVSMDALGVPF